MRFNSMIVALTGMVLLLVSIYPAYALNFPIQGARSQGMGGAGVSEIDDENAMTWNPANLNIRKGSFDAGFHASGQLQSTKDIQKEIQDLQDFEEDVNDIENITSNDYSDTESYAEFVRLTSELNDVNRDGQGLLGNVIAGLGGRKGGFGIMANNFTSFSASNDLQLDQVLIGGTGSDSATTRQAFTGSSDGTNMPGDRSTGRISTKTVNTIKQSIDQSLADRNLDIQDDLGFDAGVTSDSLANQAAYRVDEADPSGDTVTDKQLRNAVKSLIPGVVGASDNDANSFDTEDQKVVAQGIALTEVGVSYTPSTSIVSFLGGDLYAGGNLKYLQGEVGYKEFAVFKDEDEEDAVDDITETSNDFGVDLGLLYDQMDTHGFRVGVVGRNINEPEFDYPDSADTAGLDTFEVEAQYRAGLSAYPLRVIPGKALGQDWWKMNVDYDLTSTGTSLPDYESRYISVGNEFNLYNRPWMNLALRAGFRENLEQSQEGTVYTGGLGLKMAYVNLDISGTISDKEVEDEDGDERPTVAGAGMNLSVRF